MGSENNQQQNPLQLLLGRRVFDLTIVRDIFAIVRKRFSAPTLPGMS